MAINYLDSKRISALSSDISNIAYTDNTFASGWNTNGSYINVANTNIEVRFTGSGNAGIAKDISSSLVGTSLPTNGVWSFDFDLHYGTLPTIGGNLQFCVGLSDSDQDSICGTDNQKAYLLVVTSISGSNYRYRLYSINGTNVVGATGSLTQIATFSRTAASNQSDYCRLSSDGTNVKLEFFSDINRTVSIESGTVPVNGNINGLKYIKTDLYDQSSTTGFTVDIHKVTVVEGAIESRPTNVQDNSILVEKDTAKRYWYDGSVWTWENYVFTGVFGGGNDGSYTNLIDYITIATTGNATDFGDLTVGRSVGQGVSSDTRGVFGGGYSTGGAEDTMDYITVATKGNAIDFGNLTLARRGVGGNVDSDTRGIFGGGYSTGYIDLIDYITIATTGNATDFGDSTSILFNASGVSSNTRGVWGSSYRGIGVNIIDYVTIATTGNATDFGDLTIVRQEASSVNSETRGVFVSGYVGGGVYTNVMDYITIATTGNATDFGDLSVSSEGGSGVSSEVRGVMAAGKPNGGAAVNTINYITIDTTGNSTDFGDLTVARVSTFGGVNA